MNQPTQRHGDHIEIMAFARSVNFRQSIEIGVVPIANRFLALVVRQFRLATHHHTLGYGALPALAGPATDQLALELGRDRPRRSASICRAEWWCRPKYPAVT